MANAKNSKRFIKIASACVTIASSYWVEILPVRDSKALIYNY